MNIGKTTTIRPTRSCKAGALRLLLLTLLAVLSDAASPVQAAEPATIEIKRFQFEPRELTVMPGATVVWINRDQTVHSVLTKDGKFSSPGLDTDDHYTFKFEQEGDYSYYCSLHPQMVGVVHVRRR